MNTKRVTSIAVIVLLSIVFSGCAGYTLEGRGSTLPPHILRIGIPTMENNTGNADLSEMLAAEIHSELLTRGRFRLSNSRDGVDAVLEGTITSYNYVPRALDEDGLATQFFVVIVVDVTFTDLVENTVLWEQKGFRFQSEYQLSDVGSDFVNQEMESVRLAAKDMAKSLVSSILTGF